MTQGKKNDVTGMIYQIRDVGRGARLTQYRKGSNLKGAAEEKNAVPGMKSGDDGRLHDIKYQTNTRNRAEG